MLQSVSQRCIVLLMNSANKSVVLTLSRDGLGEDSTEADYDAWFSFVAANIDEGCGFEVMIEESRLRDVQEDRVTVDGARDEDVQEHVEQVIRILWDAFCSQPVAS